MAKYASFGKRENEKKKQARRVEKQNRKEERKSSGKATSFGSPDKPGGLSIQLCKSEKKEFYIRYSS